MAVVFLYLVWKCLRHDYDDRKLIVYGWLGLVVFLMCGRLVYGLINVEIWNESPMDWLWFWKKPGISLVGGFLGVVLMTVWYSSKSGWKVWSFLEDGLGVWLVSGLELILLSILKTKDIRLVILAVSLGLIWGLSIWIKRKYRSFVWYRSGKKGFGWFFVNFWWWLAIGIWSVWTRGFGLEAGVYLILSLISGVGLIMLGGVF